MKIYALTAESNAFQSLVPEELEIWKSDWLRFEGLPKAEHWPQPTFRVQNPKLNRGDFFGVAPGAIGVSKAAQLKLIDYLERSGELLELRPEDLGVSIFNATECCDCLDHENVSWVYGEKSKKPIRIQRYAFRTDLIPETPLFKIPELAKAKILAHDGFGEGDSFIAAVQRLGLKGVRFDEIWDSGDKSQ